MSTSVTKRARIAYYLSWIPMTALVAVVFIWRGLDIYWALISSLLLCVPFALVCGSSYYMTKALPLRRARLAQVLFSLSSASLLASGLWVLLCFAISNILGDNFGVELRSQATVLFGIGVAYFALSLAYHYLILALEEVHRAEKEADVAQTLSREAELRALRAQVDPHFLFNSLNSIAALTAVNPTGAREMSLLLSDFFRSTLKWGDLQSVRLSDEIALAAKYLDIEKIRFEDRMTTNQQIDEQAKDVAVPPLILQPLVENAVKHGVASLETPSQIDLLVRQISDDRFQVSITNSYAPELADHGRSALGPKRGHGLKIVQDRLASFYGDDARLVINKKDNQFQVELEFPKYQGR